MFGGLPIRKKLIIIQLFTASVVTILFGIYLVYNDQRAYRKTVNNQLDTIAQIVGQNTISALDFLDKEAAEEILLTLETQDNIVGAAIYDKEGNLFAKYIKKSQNQFSILNSASGYLEEKDGYVIYSKTIVRNGEELGKIVLGYKLAPLSSKITESAIGAILVITFGMGIALILSVLTQKTISAPLLHLAEVAKKITDTHDYRIRIDKRREIRNDKDEIGILYKSLDDMLEQIHIRATQRDKAEEELRKNREHLEEIVKERTSSLEAKTDELEQANIRLQEIDHLKSMFIASMSHELRTPLNSIIGFTGIILMGMSGELGKEQEKQLMMVKSSASHLLSLVNDIIDTSKIEAGKEEIFIEEFDLSVIIQEVKDSFNTIANEKDLKIPLKMPERLIIRSDERRVKQILVNLVVNAVKFMDEGEVKIMAEERDSIVEVSVRDTGIGIKKENMGALFKAFSQIPNNNRILEGTGLGLYLSKKLANRLGGDLAAESEFGKGSKFTLTLPLN